MRTPLRACCKLSKMGYVEATTCVEWVLTKAGWIGTYEHSLNMSTKKAGNRIGKKTQKKKQQQKTSESETEESR